MSKRKKGILAGAIVVLIILGLNIFAASGQMSVWLNRWNYDGTEMKEKFRETAEKKYGKDGKEVKTIVRNNDNVIALFSYTEDEDEGYYEIHTLTEAPPEKVEPVI